MRGDRIIWSNTSWHLSVGLYDQFNILFIWLGVMTVAVLLSPIFRNIRGKNCPFAVAGFALGGAISLVKVLIKLITQEKLQTDLDWDGSIALCINSGLGIYLSLKEVLKLF